MAIKTDETKLILGLAVISVVYFGVLKPITNKLGLTETKDDRKADAIIENGLNAKGWDPHFYKTIRVKQMLLTAASVKKLAKQIYQAWGFFNDNEEKILAAFRMLGSQAQLSQLVEAYNTAYKQDLLARVQGPWHKVKDGLDSNDLLILAKIISKLPDFKKA